MLLMGESTISTGPFSIVFRMFTRPGKTCLTLGGKDDAGGHFVVENRMPVSGKVGLLDT